MVVSDGKEEKLTAISCHQASVTQDKIFKKQPVFRYYLL